ncbi:MAG: hypothetical protein NTW21_37160 [Verrucomicrobia bacterium]|nr:hypothetical protein [Verrucomicrobiota bacterium]
MRTPIQTLTISVLLLFALPSRAEVEVYFAQDLSPYPASANNDPRPPYPKSQAVAAQFLARLQGTSTESFESFAPGTTPSNLVFGSVTATLFASAIGDCVVDQVLDSRSTSGGGFPSTGTKCLGLLVGRAIHPEEYFRVSFSSPQSAFGFYGTDVETSSFRLRLARADGSTSDVYPPITVPQGNAGVFYLGVIDRARPFTSVTFYGTGSVLDGFDFDDLTIGTPQQVLPLSPTLRMTAYQWLEITGTVGATYRIESSTDLTPTSWVTLTSFVLPASPYQWQDTTASGVRRRFYRAASVP